MSDNYTVEVSKDTLVFSAAHFITYNGNVCERLHGHNYRVRATVAGSLDENHYVIDFILLRDALQQIVAELDHRVLLPTSHARIRVDQEGAEIVARFENRRWVFPQEDCRLLPVANTTAELLASYILDRWFEHFSSAQLPQPRLVSVGVEENFGQWATAERRIPAGSTGG